MNNIKELLDFILDNLAKNELDLSSRIVIEIEQKEMECKFNLDKRKLIIETKK